MWEGNYKGWKRKVDIEEDKLEFKEQGKIVKLRESEDDDSDEKDER